MILTQTLESAYLEMAQKRRHVAQNSGTIEWECPSNIALIKYWGKHEKQLPINPSLSFTLSKSVTRTRIEFSYAKDQDFALEFQLNGTIHKPFAHRILRYFKYISQFLPFIQNARFVINSSNNFPSSAGIASSASSYGALALALCTIEKQIYRIEDPRDEFLRKASFMARLGSGSASRSVYGGYVLWGRTHEMKQSGDEAATPLSEDIHPIFRTYRDTILVVNSGAKAISSSEGHKLMNDHPYTSARIVQAGTNLSRLFEILRTGDIFAFAEIIENEALSLHALMISSNPGIILLKPETLRIIESIRNFRQESQLPIAFTLDAGPNVHLIHPDYCSNEVEDFINNELRALCEEGRIIYDGIGKGPLQIGG
jgi:diphosphomevalonate decarboxylase